MTTAEIIKQMEKEFDEEFVVFCPTGKYKGREVLNPIFPEPVISFIRSYTRTLLESFGEEVIGKEDTATPDGLGDQMAVLSKNVLRLEQRLKVKEIISEIGK